MFYARRTTSLLLLTLSSCLTEPDPVPIAAGVAGMSGSAGDLSGGAAGGGSGGSGNAGGASIGGSGGADPTGGTAGSTGGTAGSTGGTAGSTGGTAGSVSGTGGTAGMAAGTSGSAGTAGDDPGPPLPTDPSGFTTPVPSADTTTIYVSSSGGDDANDGLSPETAVATVSKGVSLLREGFPDWLLLKRGDVWQSGLGGWSLSGRSPTERMVIGAYGDGERPRLEFEDMALVTTGGISDKEYMENLVFTSLHLYGVEHDLTRGDPLSDNPQCIQWYRGARDILFEDMRFEYCTVNIQNVDGLSAERVRFHRSLFLDSYSTNAHAQAIYLLGVRTFSIEECIFDRCGWNPSVAEAEPTIFNHCVYWQSDSPPDGLVRGNVFMRASSHGTQMRASGHVEGNVYIQTAIGGFLSNEWDAAPSGPQGAVIGNLFTEGTDVLPRDGHDGVEYRGFGWDIIASMTGVTISDNIFTHCISAMPGGCRTVVASEDGYTIENNLVWDWSAPSNNLQSSPGPFLDPDRTVGSYHDSLGGGDTLDAFITEIRKQSKTNWRPAYMADAIIDYFREGFEEP